MAHLATSIPLKQLLYYRHNRYYHILRAVYSYPNLVGPNSRPLLGSQRRQQF